MLFLYVDIFTINTTRSTLSNKDTNAYSRTLKGNRGTTRTSLWKAFSRSTLTSRFRYILTHAHIFTRTKKTKNRLDYTMNVSAKILKFTMNCDNEYDIKNNAEGTSIFSVDGHFIIGRKLENEEDKRRKPRMKVIFFTRLYSFKVVLRSRRGGFGPLHAHILSGVPSGKVE